MTGLRTKWGIELAQIENEYSAFLAHFKRSSKKWVASGHLVQQSGGYRLSDQGKLISDTIISDMFY